MTVGCDVGSGVEGMVERVGCTVGFAVWTSVAIADDAIGEAPTVTAGDAPTELVGCSTDGVGD
jgi:hypothetical protein